MIELLTASQMRAVEQAAIDSGDVTGLELMERAGQGVVEAIFEEWPEMNESAGRAVVLCGPGNNGGDGFVVARLLKERGWDVELFLFGDPGKLPRDARVNYERWAELGPVAPFSQESLAQSKGHGSHDKIVVVDALFGTGLTRPLDPGICGILDMVGGSDGFADARRVSVDMPSGLCSDSGRGLWENEPRFPRECLTVTFHSAKLGHFLRSPAKCIGSLASKDIGLNKAISSDVVTLTHCPDLDALDKGGRHKYSHGHALILSGPPSKGGAARLAARGALRIGAGLVTLGCPLRAQAENAAHLNAIMLQPLDGPPGLSELLEYKRISAIGLGPGLGLGKVTHDFVAAALKAQIPTVLDADALSRYERHPDVLLDSLHDQVVLTPHGGEFKRLFPDIAEKLEAPATSGPAFSKVDAARAAAARAGCVVVFKGAATVIAAPDGRCSINSARYDRAAPWLATAGSGDVLAGFITGLLARGFSPMQAAESAAWLHVEAALEFGPGLIAEDLPEMLPKVLSRLLG